DLHANPNLDFAAASGLKGSERFENALGLLLRQSRLRPPYRLSGSATRVSSFRRDRTRYWTQWLIQEDQLEQNVNFFSGHIVHGSLDWAIARLQEGRRPSEEEFSNYFRRIWKQRMEEKPVALKPGDDMLGWQESRLDVALGMYREALAAHDRGELFVGTEIPNFMILKEYERRTQKLKGEYLFRTIFDWVALRPDPDHPGHARLVVYDFKSGPMQTAQNLAKDVQALTYALFVRDHWVGRPFPYPYFSGDREFFIDGVDVEFVYGPQRQPALLTDWSIDLVRGILVRTLKRMDHEEKQLLGLLPRKKPKNKAAAQPTAAGQAPAARKPRRRAPLSPEQRLERRVQAAIARAQALELPAAPVLRLNGAETAQEAVAKLSDGNAAATSLLEFLARKDTNNLRLLDSVRLYGADLVSAFELCRGNIQKLLKRLHEDATLLASDALRRARTK
ncbi:MAG: PD-(D/E)XK nuclease family protein, partial [Elusimicrobia bacterium]|nr:PD-(D/E)XK nuclease family protein [Elusimicrobiota bacterium]